MRLRLQAVDFSSFSLLMDIERNFVIFAAYEDGLFFSHGIIGNGLEFDGYFYSLHIGFCVLKNLHESYNSTKKDHKDHSTKSCTQRRGSDIWEKKYCAAVAFFDCSWFVELCTGSRLLKANTSPSSKFPAIAGAFCAGKFSDLFVSARFDHPTSPHFQHQISQ